MRLIVLGRWLGACFIDQYGVLNRNVHDCFSLKNSSNELQRKQGKDAHTNSSQGILSCDKVEFFAPAAVSHNDSLGAYLGDNTLALKPIDFNLYH